MALIEPIDIDVIENQNRTKARHGHPGTDESDQDSNLSLSEWLKIFRQSFFKAAVQDPINGLTQLSPDSVPLPQLKIVAEQDQAKLGTERWYAQTLGSGTGSVVPFVLIEAGTSRLGKLPIFRKLFEKADSIPVLQSVMGATKSGEYLSHGIKTALDGAIYGGVFVPTDSDNGNFWKDRAIDTASVGLTFGGQYAVSHGILCGLERSGLGHMHFHQGDEITFRSAVTRLSTNFFGGIAAGGIGALSMSYLYTGLLPSRDMTENALASFAVTGLFLDTAHMSLPPLARFAGPKLYRLGHHSLNLAGSSTIGKAVGLDRITSKFLKLKPDDNSAQPAETEKAADQATPKPENPGHETAQPEFRHHAISQPETPEHGSSQPAILEPEKPKPDITPPADH